MNKPFLLRRLFLAGFFCAGLIAATSVGLLSAATTNAAPSVTTTNGTTKIESTNSTTGKKETIQINKDADDDSDSDDSKGSHSARIEINSDHDGSGFDWALLIPLFGIIGSFGLPLGVVFFVFYFRHRRRMEKFALAREFLAKGMPVPQELLDESRFDPSDVAAATQGKTPLSQRDIRRGFRLAFIGLGVILALYIEWPKSSTWGWGLIPMVMGIGFIISGAIQSNYEKSRGPTQPTPPQPPR